jgi:hypothetical protein
MWIRSRILGNQYRSLYHERRIFFLRQLEEGDYSAYQQNSQKEIDNLPVLQRIFWNIHDMLSPFLFC